MKHDSQYRRVLRSQDYFLQKYKAYGIMILFGYYVFDILTDNIAKKNNKNLQEELSKLEDKDLSKFYLHSTNS
jgi:hypothetical protein